MGAPYAEDQVSAHHAICSILFVTAVLVLCIYGGRELLLKIFKFVGIIFVMFF